MVDTTLFPSMVHYSQNMKHVGAPSVVHVLLHISGPLLENWGLDFITRSVIV